MNVFKLEVLKPHDRIYEGEVSSLITRALDGELGILAGHAPLLTVLGKGELLITPKDKSELKIEVTSGILKVENNLAQVFLDR